MNTITCKSCKRGGVQRKHKGVLVFACPECGGILYRPIGREAAEQLGGIRP